MIINVDTGGTHTDVFLIDEENERQATGKAPTTDYDLSVGFMNAIETAATEWDMALQDVLDRSEMIKYSTTTGVNAIIEGTGPRLGLITTRGFEDIMHTGKSRNWADGLDRESRLDFARARRPEMLIPHERRVGVRERVDRNGEVVMPLDEEEVRERVRHLVDQGVRGFVVSLLWSHENPVHERRIEEIIKEEYPDVYLGNMPVFLSCDISPKVEEYTRTITTTLNAYMATTAEEHILDLTDTLREREFTDPLFAVRNTGGVASISRTAPLHLFDAGPIAGVLGSAFIGRLYEEENVLATDMGGTSFDLGISMENEERNYEFHPVVDRWRIQLPIIETTSIGAGGGSIAHIDDVGHLQVGPESAGANPGPVCYNQGGTEPTVTDADLVLGYLNPDFFLGGRQRLSLRKAERAINRHIARPLGIDVETAAYRIRKLIDGKMGQEIHKQTALKGYDPREFVMFSFGGAGPVHACDCAEYVDVSKIITFPYGSVFNAFGANTMDIVQTYEESANLTLYDPRADRYTTTYEAFNDTVERLTGYALRDMSEEGLSESDISFSLELDCIYASQIHPFRFTSPVTTIDDRDDVVKICDAFNRAYGDSYSKGATFPEGGIELENIKLNAVAPLDDPTLPTYELADPSPSTARKGERGVIWDIDDGRVETPIYDRGELVPGNVIEGPAIIEDVGTTHVVNPGRTYAVDEYDHGIITMED